MPTSNTEHHDHAGHDHAHTAALQPGRTAANGWRAMGTTRMPDMVFTRGSNLHKASPTVKARRLERM